MSAQQLTGQVNQTGVTSPPGKARGFLVATRNKGTRERYHVAVPLQGIQTFRGVGRSVPSKPGYLRSAKCSWCRRSQIRGLPLPGFPATRSHRPAGSNPNPQRPRTHPQAGDGHKQHEEVQPALVGEGNPENLRPEPVGGDHGVGLFRLGRFKARKVLAFSHPSNRVFSTVAP
jgi:hypothetical protein